MSPFKQIRILFLVVFPALTLPASACFAEASKTTVGVVEFSYLDTSGEVRDQTARHKALMDRLMSALRDNLEKDGAYRLVTPDCNGEACHSDTTPPDILVDGAQKAGASLLLIGGVHKISTLVQWLQIQVVEISGHKVLFDRQVTFRGDDETAWARAGRFIARNLEQNQNRFGLGQEEP